MSKKFIDFSIPPKEVEKILTKKPYHTYPRCLTIPYYEDDPDSPCTECIVLACCTKKKCDKLRDWKEGKHFQTLIECWVNLGVSLFNRMSNVEHPIGYNKISGIPMKFIFLFKLICRLLGYLVNCKSWKDKKIYYFDKNEFKRRIKHLKLF